LYQLIKKDFYYTEQYNYNTNIFMAVFISERWSHRKQAISKRIICCLFINRLRQCRYQCSSRGSQVEKYRNRYMASII